jgi:hypothetical protein
MILTKGRKEGKKEGRKGRKERRKDVLAIISSR